MARILFPLFSPLSWQKYPTGVAQQGRHWFKTQWATGCETPTAPAGDPQ